MCCQHNVIKPQLKLITPSMEKVNFRKITYDTHVFKFYGQGIRRPTVANVNGPKS